jgi:predicted metalloendopeptidase
MPLIANLYNFLFAVVPLGVMTTPYHVPSVPKYVNMGKIGSIIAHEIIHHFDATGIEIEIKRVFEIFGTRVLQA